MDTTQSSIETSKLDNVTHYRENLAIFDYTGLVTAVSELEQLQFLNLKALNRHQTTVLGLGVRFFSSDNLSYQEFWEKLENISEYLTPTKSTLITVLKKSSESISNYGENEVQYSFVKLCRRIASNCEDLQNNPFEVYFIGSGEACSKKYKEIQSGFYKTEHEKPSIVGLVIDKLYSQLQEAELLELCHLPIFILEKILIRAAIKELYEMENTVLIEDMIPKLYRLENKDVLAAKCLMLRVSQEYKGHPVKQVLRYISDSRISIFRLFEVCGVQKRELLILLGFVNGVERPVKKIGRRTSPVPRPVKKR